MFLVFQVVPEDALNAWLPESAKSLGFYLANPFPGHANLLPDLLEGMAFPIRDAISQSEDPDLTGGQGLHHFLEVFLEEMFSGCFIGKGSFMVLHKISQDSIPFIGGGHLQGKWPAGYFHHVLNFIRGLIQCICQLLNGGFSFQ
jgi:hypothetical protein